MKYLTLYLLVSSLLVGFSDESIVERKNHELSEIPMCSTTSTEGRCTGSSYCTACKNCKYCGHCSNGGSCGVCAIAPITKPGQNVPHSYRHRSGTIYRDGGNDLTSPAALPNQQETITYKVIQSTSLRKSATHKSGVILRLQENEIVYLMENTDEWWWKVRYKGYIGWAKKACLSPFKSG